MGHKFPFEYEITTKQQKFLIDLSMDGFKKQWD